MLCKICGSQISVNGRSKTDYCQECLSFENKRQIHRFIKYLEKLEKKGLIYCLTDNIPLNSVKPYRLIQFKIPIKKF